MTTPTTPSTQQRNADAWLTLKAALDTHEIDYSTRTEYDGALVVTCSRQYIWSYCDPTIRIGPGAGVALVRVEGKCLVPDSYCAYVNRVLAVVSRQCVLGSLKFNVGTGKLVAETPILFIKGSLRPEDALYALRRMGSLLDAVAEELWEVFSFKQRMTQAQEKLEERARRLVGIEMNEDD